MSMDKTEFLDLAIRVAKLEEGQKTLRGVYSDALISKITAYDTRLRQLTRMAIDLGVRLKAIEEEPKTKVRSILTGPLNSLVAWVGTLEEKLKAYLMTWLNRRLRHDKEKEADDES